MIIGAACLLTRQLACLQGRGCPFMMISKKKGLAKTRPYQGPINFLFLSI
jgi:hypothetical protein